jgi:hypothetical protein
MIAARRLQRHFADGFIADSVGDLWVIMHLTQTAKKRILKACQGRITGSAKA